MAWAVRLSSVYLSSVCDVGARYPEGWTFRQYFASSDAQGLGHFALKFAEKFEWV